MIKSLLVCVALAAWSFGEDLGSAMTSTATLPVAPNCNSPLLLQRNAACAFGKTYYLVAWSDGRDQPIAYGADIYCARVEATTGNIIDPNGILVCHANGVQNYPAVAFDGTNFLVVWEDMRSRNDLDIYGARVSEAGQLLDAQSFAISAKPGNNEVRPTVAFANGNYFVAWADARQYPLYNVYGSRVTTAGVVLDVNGTALGTEDSAKIAAAKPANGRFLGNYLYNGPWWASLNSRYNPQLTSNGTQCFLNFLVENNGPKWGLIDPSTGVFTPTSTDYSSYFRGLIRSCAVTPTSNGWAINANITCQGWGQSTAYTSIRINGALATTDTYDYSHGVHEIVFDSIGESTRQYGTYFHKVATGFLKNNILLAMDYAWIDKNADAATTKYAIFLNRIGLADTNYLEANPGIPLEMNIGTIVKRPAICNGPSNECLLVFQKEADTGNCRIVSKLIREK